MNRARRIVAPALATVMLLSTSVPALAVTTPSIPTYAVVSQTQDVLSVYTDIPETHWARKSGGLAYCVEKGYMTGTSTTTFNPNGLVSINQFATVLVRMSISEGEQATYGASARTAWVAEQQANQAKEGREVQSTETLEAMYNAKSGVHWAYEPMHTAKQAGLLENVDVSGIGDELCSRGVMAQLIANTLKLRGEDTSKVDTATAIGYMSDARDIKASPNKDAIGIAIGSGIISGVGGNKFNLDGTMDRASACEVMLRLDNPNGERAKVLEALQTPSNTTPPSDDRLPNIPGNPGGIVGGDHTGEDTNTKPITIDMRSTAEKDMHRAPREGDTVIRLDGTKVVLARDPVTGVLGAFQNVGPYLNTKCLDGRPVVDGDFTGPIEAGWSDSLADGRYMQAGIEGWESTWLWTNEWAALRNKTFPTSKGTEGQIDSTGLWRVGASGNWIWRGPSC